MKALATLLITFTLSCHVSLAQNVVISHGIPEPKSNNFSEVLDYVSQMKNLERSLVSGSLKKTLMFSKEFKLTDSVFKMFSDLFNAAVPENFFTQEDRVRILTEEFGKQKNPRIQWTYATIEKSDSVVKYAQLIVYFESRKKNKTPTIRSIELQTQDVTTSLTNEQIVQLYERVKSIKVELPAPPVIEH